MRRIFFSILIWLLLEKKNESVAVSGRFILHDETFDPLRGRLLAMPKIPSVKRSGTIEKS